MASEDLLVEISTKQQSDALLALNFVSDYKGGYAEVVRRGPARPVSASTGTQTSPDDLRLSLKSPPKPTRAVPVAPGPKPRVDTGSLASTSEQGKAPPGRGRPPRTSGPNRPGEPSRQSTSQGRPSATHEEPMDESGPRFDEEAPSSGSVFSYSAPGGLLLGNTKSSWKTSACLAAFSNGVMGNLAIVLLLMCTVSSCVARPGISLFPDGYNPVSSSGVARPGIVLFPVSTSKGTASSAGFGALFVLFDDVPMTLLPKRPAVEKSATETSDEHGVLVLLHEFVKTSFRHPGAMAQEGGEVVIVHFDHGAQDCWHGDAF
ncbi:hypothetical protein ISCGN_027233 [Ixodes scapularis]